MAGAVLMPPAFLIGAQWGIIGIGWTWVVAYPLLLIFSAARSLPVIGLSWGEFARAVAPPVLAAAAMALLVTLVDRILPPMPGYARLALLVATGAPIYCLWLFFFARDTAEDLVAMIRGRRGVDAG